MPTMVGEVERRLLVNYSVDPAVLRDQVPSRFRLQLVDGRAVAGICLIRLGGLRPRGLPAAVGMTTENAAHRIAVEWDEDGELRRGVYIARRDTASRLTTLLGGRAFPGAHHLADFRVQESDTELTVAFTARDGSVDVSVEAGIAEALDSSRLFATVDDASAFFEQGAVGWSPGHDPRRLEGIRLSTDAWSVEPCRDLQVRSTFFDALPAGSAELDCALAMRRVPVVWNALPAVMAGAR